MICQSLKMLRYL